ncbi:Serine/threonine-protein kinase nrc-2 [Porphyridium purpureum]|uniref:non-specific serine/threonine protein kinase n=1 Tax=Porphyridium purpureum TaxID=35688 RepID=A0A5J4Z3H1_PORPP|nr:Serine/threonine-protein kinase nrc-2 [Porphyridium purpureum]|eukprot:POR8956..scf295_1
MSMRAFKANRLPTVEDLAAGLSDKSSSLASKSGTSKAHAPSEATSPRSRLRLQKIRTRVKDSTSHSLVPAEQKGSNVQGLKLFATSKVDESKESQPKAVRTKSTIGFATNSKNIAKAKPVSLSLADIDIDIDIDIDVDVDEDVHNDGLDFDEDNDDAEAPYSFKGSLNVSSPSLREEPLSDSLLEKPSNLLRLLSEKRRAGNAAASASPRGAGGFGPMTPMSRLSVMNLFISTPGFISEDGGCDETFSPRNTASVHRASSLVRFAVVEGGVSAGNDRERFLLSQDELSPDRFLKVKRLGRGAHGTVYLACIAPSANGATEKAEQEARSDENASDSRPVLYAVKVVLKEDLVRSGRVQRALTEHEILRTVKHPNLVRTFASFHTERRLFFVMQHMPGGELYKMLRKQPFGPRVSEEAARFYAAQVLLALEHLHSFGYIYRDLKPENVLVYGSGHVALADFDLCTKIDPIVSLSVPRVSSQPHHTAGQPKAVPLVEKSHSPPPEKSKVKIKWDKTTRARANSVKDMGAVPVRNKSTRFDAALMGSRSFVGTEEYISPEVASGLPQHFALDWWCLGIFIYELIYARTPFHGESQEETFKNIVEKAPEFPSAETDGTGASGASEACHDLILKLLHKNPPQRLGYGSVAEIKSHAWFAGVEWDALMDIPAPIVPEYEYPNELVQKASKTLNEIEIKLRDDGPTVELDPKNVEELDALFSGIDALE